MGHWACRKRQALFFRSFFNLNYNFLKEILMAYRRRARSRRRSRRRRRLNVFARRVGTRF